MMKFGYRLGGGLGRHGQGRVEPVPIVILDEGKGLELASENARTYEGKKVKQVVRLQPPQQKPQDNDEVDAFGFINSAINRPKRRSSAGPKLGHLNEEECRARLLKLSGRLVDVRVRLSSNAGSLCRTRQQLPSEGAQASFVCAAARAVARPDHAAALPSAAQGGREAVLQQAQQQQKTISHTRKKQKDSSMKTFRF